MSNDKEWFALEEVADRLGLHVRTVRNYVRDGRLGAVRIGKQYRVSRADLQALTGGGARPDGAGGPRRIEVTSVLDVDGIDGAVGERLAALVTGLPKGPRAPHVDVVHESERGRLKVIVVGSVEASVELLRFVGAMAEGAA
jgi:excisionase family DNA binding protein